MKKILILILFPLCVHSQPLTVSSLDSVIRDLQMQIDNIKNASQPFSKNFVLKNGVVDLALASPVFDTGKDTAALVINIDDRKGTGVNSHSILFQSNGYNKLGFNQYGVICTDRTDEPTGSTGNKTHWTSQGSVNYAKGTKTIVITNFLLRAGCHIIPVLETNDTYLKSVVATYNYTTNQFTITGNANAAAECRVAYTITGRTP